MEKWEHLKISFAHIKDATNDFRKTIGKGGYGWVYEGELFINGRNIKVAVKRLCCIRDKDGILLLADVAKEYYANDKLDKIIDPVLREQMSSESLRKYSAIVYKCLQDRELRPLMGVVKKELEAKNPGKFPKGFNRRSIRCTNRRIQKLRSGVASGLRIGATPMISILKDIVNNMKAKEDEENALENGATLQKNKPGSRSANNFRTTRAYFHWVTREEGSFNWLKFVMNEAAEMDKNGVIEMHNYCTIVYEEGNARSALITMLQSLNHAKNGFDVVSSTRVKSHFAKPN
ncbi:hypothetical protein L1987_79147 [Smallanthus sonchifolius]|uniref:Uncharacterized protein n=1 Tax=Smallanthus sonchifolius TaxID=185202 RepID=A0ACB8ZFP5_9ASTR|nr:hypothetical protein L1987_79147 [Smallanthus sonchifolius]